MSPSRVATGLAVVAGVAGAVAPVVGNMDWTSTAGVEAGVLAAVLAIVKWLDGRKAYEQSLWEHAAPATKNEWVELDPMTHQPRQRRPRRRRRRRRHAS